LRAAGYDGAFTLLEQGIGRYLAWLARRRQGVGRARRTPAAAAQKTPPQRALAAVQKPLSVLIFPAHSGSLFR